MHRSMTASPSSSSSRLVSSLLLLSLALLAAAVPTAWSAEPELQPAAPRPAGPARGPATGPAGLPPIRGPGGRIPFPMRPTARVVKVTGGSLVVHPTTAPAGVADAAPRAAGTGAAAPAPATAPAGAGGEDQPFTIDNDRTRVSIQVVIAERMTATGQTIRQSRYEPGELADLEPGQFVHVIFQDGVATQIAIMPDPDAPLPAPATIVKVDEKSITVQPAPPTPPAAPRPRARPRGAAGAGPGNAAPPVDGAPAAPPADAPAPAAAAPTTAPAERTYVTDPQTTRVTISEVTGRGGGGGPVTTVRMRRGALSDLKVGQSVEVRARGDTAVHIRVMPGPQQNADGTVR